MLSIQPSCLSHATRANKAHFLATSRGPYYKLQQRTIGQARWKPAASTSATSISMAIQQQTDDFSTDQRPVVLYDGICRFCNKNVNIMLSMDKSVPARFRLAAMQSEAGKRLLQRIGRHPSDLSSVVLIEKDKHYVKSDAVLRIAQGLGAPLPLLATFGFPVPKLLRDFLYDQVAKNRYSILGRLDQCRLDDPAYRERFILE